MTAWPAIARSIVLKTIGATSNEKKVMIPSQPATQTTASALKSLIDATRGRAARRSRR